MWKVWRMITGGRYTSCFSAAGICMEKKKREMGAKELALLALRTDQWCHMFLIQTGRFIDALEDGTGGSFPWEENDRSSLFIGDRMFLITALHHAIKSLRNMQEELARRGENVEVINSIIEKIGTQRLLNDIRALRNMNEHDLEYMTGNGKSPEKFVCTVEKNGCRYRTTAHATVVIGDARSFTIGNIQIGDLVEKMKGLMPKIDRICQEIFEKYFC